MTPPPSPPRTPKPEWARAFKKRREDVVGSQEELAIQADVSQSLISQIERGVQHPTGVSVERFTRLLGVLKWSVEDFSLATGIGLVTAPTKEEPSVQPADLFDHVFVEPHCLAHAGPGDSLDTVPRGSAVMVRKADIRRRYTEYAYASGNSMTKPDGSGIHDGALLFVDVNDLELRDGDAYLIKVPGNGFYVKRARWQFDEWWLHSDNPEYPPYQEEKALVVGHVYRVQNPAFKP